MSILRNTIWTVWRRVSPKRIYVAKMFIRPTMNHAGRESCVVDGRADRAGLCQLPTGECNDYYNYAVGSRGTTQRRRRNLNTARYIIQYGSGCRCSADKTSETTNYAPHNSAYTKY